MVVSSAVFVCASTMPKKRDKGKTSQVVSTGDMDVSEVNKAVVSVGRVRTALWEFVMVSY